ncbi:MAG: imidazole glycerol phosphate synthase subunit HisH, partial [Ruminococcus sp.]|nr:imidazole glycerol phosphate synthase subunit HisH [Ruminococcus sp.]
MIAIIDYGAGNIFSVKNALDYLGLESKLVSDKESVKAADAVILQGVGSFPEDMKKLEATGLLD